MILRKLVSFLKKIFKVEKRRQLRYYKNNKEYLNAYCKHYYQVNKDKIKEKARKRYFSKKIKTGV